VKKAHRLLQTAGSDRINTIINSSKRIGDALYVDLEQRLTIDPNTSIQCHKRCVSSYSSKTHILTLFFQRNAPPTQRNLLQKDFVD